MQYNPERIQSFVCDLTDDQEISIEENSIDICSMIFVLSAIHPDKMVHVLRKLHRVRTFNQSCENEEMILSF